MPVPTWKWTRTFCVLILLAGILALFYWPSLNDALSFGVEDSISTLQRKGIGSMRWLWTTNAYTIGEPDEAQYSIEGVPTAAPLLYGPFEFRPLGSFYAAWLSWAFGHNAPAQRAARLVLYYLETVLVFVIVYVFTRTWRLAIITSLLFVTSPLAFPILVLVLPLFDPFLFLYLTAVLFYLLSRQAKTRWIGFSLMGGSVICSLGALLSSELSITLPLIITLIEVFQGKVLRRWPYRLRSTLPCYGTGLLYMVIRVAALMQTRHAQEGLSWHGWYLGQIFSLDTVVHGATEFTLLFLPNFLRIRTAVKTWFFGDTPGFRVVDWHHGTFAIAGGVMLVMGLLLGYWLMRKPGVRAFLFSNEQGPFLLFGLGWIVLTLLPAAPLPVDFGRLMLQPVGASLVKAVGISLITEDLRRRWRIREGLISSVLLIFLLFYNFSEVARYLKEHEFCNAVRTNVVNAIRTLPQVPDEQQRRTPVYLLNYIHGIGLCTTGSDTPGWRKVIRRETGREDVDIKIPYTLWDRDVQEYQKVLLPTVTFIDARTVIVTSSSQGRRPHLVTARGFDYMGLRNNLRLRSRQEYSIEIREIDEVTKSLKDFLIHVEERQPVVFFTNQKSQFSRLHPPEDSSAR